MEDLNEMKHKGLFDNPIFLKPFDWSKLKKGIKKQLERNEKWIAKYNAKKKNERF
jgi:hypothetical protein